MNNNNKVNKRKKKKKNNGFFFEIVLRGHLNVICVSCCLAKGISCWVDEWEFVGFGSTE